MEQLLIILAILAISAISNWLKKKGHLPEDDPDLPPVAPPARPRVPGEIPRPSQPTSSPRPTLSNWEEELRRMLDMPSSQPPPIPQSQPPPPVLVTAPPVQPRPIIIRTESKPSSPPPTISMPSSVPVPAMESHLGSLKHAAEAYQEAIDLHGQVASRLMKAANLHHQAIHVVPPSRHVTYQATTLAALRQPQGLRQAFVASLVFGKPKALEES